MQTSGKPLVTVQQCSISRAQQWLVRELSFALHAGQHLAITGPSGSGKTSLLLALLNQLPYTGQVSLDATAKPAAIVGQIHQFKNKSNTADLYYQQRYHAFDAEDAMTAQEWIGADTTSLQHSMPDLAALLPKPLVQLSHGEHKKVQLARALTAQPRLLLLDQPFVGLDSASRQWLHTQLNSLAASGVSIIITASGSEIPDCITHILALQAHGRFLFTAKADWDNKTTTKLGHHPWNEPGFDQMLQHLVQPSPFEFEEAFRLENVSVAYGDKPVLQHISWKVRRGERWLLHGPNGAGKSTLLSLITADHPQAYANEIYLFGRRRGTGESIWDIKKKIGFVSPELQMYFQQTATCYHTVASGIFDTIGLFRTLHPADEEKVQLWLQLLGMATAQHKPFRSFSTGEQRLMLLARALIKNPPLLVLDEPCQGLDEEQQHMMIQWIDRLCVAGHKTLVYVTHYVQERPSCINHVLALAAPGTPG